MASDLYRRLEVSPEASDDEIKKSFRRLALRYHPDRNFQNQEAEERFKDVNYAYSVLGNNEKRRRYDLYREFQTSSARWGFSITGPHERFLEDLFLHANLSDLGKGFPWNLETLFHNHPLFSVANSTFQYLNRFYQTVRKDQPSDNNRFSRLFSGLTGDFDKVGKSFRSFMKRDYYSSKNSGVSRAGKTGSGKSSELNNGFNEDIDWTLPLTSDEAVNGARLTVSFLQDSCWEKVMVQVPPGIREGVKLRVRSKGNLKSGSTERGDLYLRVLLL